MYALGKLRCHRLTGEALHEVTRATTMAQVMYASQAWWGYRRAKDQEKLERLVERLKRQGFLSMEDMDISQQANKADQKLFQAIRNNPHHVLYRLLPELKKTGYNTKAHNFVLPPKGPSIYDVHKKITFLTFPPPCPHASTWAGPLSPLWTSTHGRHEIHTAVVRVDRRAGPVSKNTN